MKTLFIPNAVAQAKMEQTVKDQLPNLLDWVQTMRPILEVFQQNEFAGVPTARQFTVQDFNYPSGSRGPQLRFIGHWLKKLGFEPGRKIQMISLKDLLVICPDIPSPCAGNLVTPDNLINAPTFASIEMPLAI